ncbi:MAG: hypothetical protein A3H57_02335 [Candidatus Taylorbacteria bacterium RIFCSPLOWO2_02_FULL_43_11]|uniref:Uncharacterized protein n=1 Tax=Candidatus Taylorbacteria bacterium RIFCSPHIGHO2_02_FULL_43_32b TaxID=1802306 RepID=A0A1G2MJI2_9BACT|nr:MAG: hypothetical protein A2743_03655 [Candidatus Taylorbacteria bacterium RIFCSPHIGHO2_01_FULL_43_47]OHA23329.1 MAG: hypothetical protein A3C72_00550 [Candidatus Taylorbacteria bacterium RIFCSPHIGHO2_02_FULL_43_32b]OHA30302.1 MAG: hypothetical protein A3B08_01790 [Candidatus Taylorbacteria bacterium RIFCSPLOWO2_01_FULL_43_44]OHA36898.1 MAG: hypothetical protein A3H57_02335 [Candidatus Taylorbacteria bacterium RIFCSPLOWO2_02_FULL_43_11]
MGNIDSRKYNGNVYFSSSKNMNANTDEITLSLRDFLVERLHGGEVEGDDDDFRFRCDPIDDDEVSKIVEEYYNVGDIKLIFWPDTPLLGRLEKAGGWLATIIISNYSQEFEGHILGTITVMHFGSA